MMTFQFDDSLKNPKTLTALNTVLFIILLFLILLFAREIISSLSKSRPAPARSRETAQAETGRSFQDYAAILKRNPFGPPAGELKMLTSGTSTSASPADITLVGTISGEGSGYAIFLDRSWRQDIYRVGQEVPGIGRLTRVEKEKAYINASGREIAIPFSDITEVREIRAPGAPASLSIGRRTGDSAYMIDQQKILQALERPDQIMTDARFTPHMVDGRQQGFILREVKPQGIYSGLGLQNGDILLRINEYSISSAESALQALTALRGIDRAQLDIIRNGSNMTMTYQIR